MLDRNLELFKSRLCVAKGKKIDRPVSRRELGWDEGGCHARSRVGWASRVGKVEACPRRAVRTVSGANDGDVTGGRLHTTRHPPRKRRIQYAAASRLKHNRLWTTGSPAFAGDDSRGRAQTHFAISRRHVARALCFIAALERERAQGKPGARCTRGLVCKSCTKKTHTSIQVQRRHPDFPCAVVSTGLYRALPGDRAFLPPSPLRTCVSQELDASVGASGPHGFALRRSHARQSQLPRPPHPTARS